MLTRELMIEEERDYMRKNDPVDFLMNMIAGVAFFVGMIIVYQILYRDVMAHLAQFATLKAIGFGNGFLLRIIISEGLILSLIGFGPGLGAAHLLTRLTGNVIKLPVKITANRVVGASPSEMTYLAPEGASPSKPLLLESAERNRCPAFTIPRSQP